MAPMAVPCSGTIFTSFICIFFCFPTQKQMKTPAVPRPNEILSYGANLYHQISEATN